MAKTTTPTPSAADRLAAAKAELADLAVPLSPVPSADPEAVDASPTAQLVDRGSRRLALETMLPAFERAALIEHLADLKARLTPALHEQSAEHAKVREIDDELERVQQEHFRIRTVAAAVGQRVETLTTEIVAVEHELGALDDLHGVVVVSAGIGIPKPSDRIDVTIEWEGRPGWVRFTSRAALERYAEQIGGQMMRRAAAADDHAAVLRIDSWIKAMRSRAAIPPVRTRMFGLDEVIVRVGTGLQGGGVAQRAHDGTLIR